MKKAFVFLSMAMLVSLLVIGCGHRTGNNPLGVTGGGENGYGSLGTGTSDGFNGGGGGGSTDLLGTWRYDISSSIYQLMSFNSTGGFSQTVYSSGEIVYNESGTYSTSGNQITLTIDGESETGTFSVSGNTMTLTIGGDTYIFHRV